MRVIGIIAMFGVCRVFCRFRSKQCSALGLCR